VTTFAARCVVTAASRAHREKKPRREVDEVLNIILILAALTGLPALTEAGRLLISLLVRLIGLAFVMALVMIILLALATHGKVI
jgi:hypothetical protein